jgi:hypothetical protein
MPSLQRLSPYPDRQDRQRRFDTAAEPGFAPFGREEPSDLETRIMLRLDTLKEQHRKLQTSIPSESHRKC